MLYIFEEEDLLAFAAAIQDDALNANGNFADCYYYDSIEILEEAKGWATISK